MAGKRVDGRLSSGWLFLAVQFPDMLILVAGLILYLRCTTPKNLTGRYGMLVFVVLMLAFNLVMFGPPLQTCSSWL